MAQVKIDGLGAIVTISATEHGSVEVESSAMGVLGEMSAAEAREIASALADVADEADKA